MEPDKYIKKPAQDARMVHRECFRPETETFPPPSLFHVRGIGFARKQFLEQQATRFVLNLKNSEFLSQEIGRKARELTLQAHPTTTVTTGSAPLWG